jgi:hypothetical protein
MKKNGRPPKIQGFTRVVRSVCFDKCNIDFIDKSAKEQDKSFNDILNSLLNNIRTLRGE